MHACNSFREHKGYGGQQWLAHPSQTSVGPALIYTAVLRKHMAASWGSLIIRHQVPVGHIRQSMLASACCSSLEPAASTPRRWHAEHALPLPSWPPEHCQRPSASLSTISACLCDACACTALASYSNTVQLGLARLSYFDGLCLCMLLK